MQENSDQIEIISHHSTLLESVQSFLQIYNSKNTIEVQTSGSTGKPKKYNVQKERFIRSAERTCDFFNLKEGDRAFLCISPKYIGGKMMIIRALTRKMKLELGEVAAFPFLEKSELDFAAFVPLQIKCILERDPDYLKRIKNIIIGGGAIDPFTEKLLVQHEINAYSTFGMTETLSHIALRKVGTEEFILLDSVKIKTDSENRLIIMDPEVTGLDELQTNDIVVLTGPNSFIWKGRHDNVINSGGVKLYPEVIEKKLSEAIPNPFFIAKEKDRIFGEKVILIIEGKTREMGDLTPYLDKFEIPKNIYFLDQFVYTETEKINRIKTLEKLGIEG